MSVTANSFVRKTLFPLSRPGAFIPARAAALNGALIAALSLAATPAWAQSAPTDASFDRLGSPVSAEGNGQWSGNLGVGFTQTSGNSSSTQFSLSGEAQRLSDSHRWMLRGLMIRNRTEGNTTADNAQASVRHERDLSKRWFAFGDAAYERDRLQDLSLRQSYSLGAGHRVLDTERMSLNLYAGVAYTLLDRKQRANDEGAEFLVGNDFAFDLTDTATFTQRLIYFPRTVGPNNGKRAVFEAGINTRLVGALGLQVTYLHKYNSDVPAGASKTDRILFTGITASF